MVTKKEFAEFCFSLTEEQRKMFLKILTCSVKDLLSEPYLNNDDITINEFLEQTLFTEIEWKATAEVYEKYKSFCIEHNKAPVKHSTFSKAVIRFYPLEIISKKIKGVKHRIFVAKG